MTNPYAPPAFDDGNFTPPGGPQPGAPLPWEVGEVYKIAWEIIKREPILVVVVLGLYMLQNVPSIVLNVMQGLGVLDQESIVALVVVILVFVAALVLSIFLSIGQVRLFIAVARGQRADFSLLLSGADRMLATIVLAFLMVMGFYIGLLGLCIGGIIVGLATSLAPCYLIDAKQGIIESLKSSWRVTRGNRLNLFAFFLVGVVISTLGICAACVGYFVAWAVVYAGWAVIYLRSIGENIIVGAPPPEGETAPVYAPQGMG